MEAMPNPAEQFPLDVDRSTPFLTDNFRTAHKSANFSLCFWNDIPLKDFCNKTFTCSVIALIYIQINQITILHVKRRT